ncbi:MATE family efflux transporter [Bordetella genomosp. 9]|uniref:Multidrug-efflux transporter n=1 Tax=Bordetella genomosp. 9 TaxID=1416803 RepID=A0A1W6Z1R0_9BORD|nr:MATE family efflux transporter [Bordetella genomosp. 9]ARP86763.1 MATE family efflux transporter [Bordetella genomosp. 9]ARP90757.1 MATE family efflux transporter [Bordetella genomosp. 9]
MSATALSPGLPAPPTLSRHAADTVKLAAPLAVAQLSQMAMGVTDTLMLGMLGPAPLAAGGLGAQFYFVIVTLLEGVLSSVSITVAHALGARDGGRVPRIYWTGLLLSVLLAVPAFVLLSFTEAILLRLGEPAELARDVGVYTNVVRWGAFASLIGVGMMRAFLPAIGGARRLLWFSLGSVGVNALLNYGLIFGAFGLPAMGLTGSAAATAITVWIMAIALLGTLHGSRRHRDAVRAARVDWRLMGELFRLGWPVAITYGVEAGLFLATGLMIGLLGATPLAAHQIALSVTSMTFMVPLALGQAANVRVGYWMGAGHTQAARHAGFVAMGLGAAVMAVTGLVYATVPRAVVGLYLALDDPANAATIAIAASLLGVAAVFQLVDGMQAVCAGCLRGLRDTRAPMLAAVCGYWCIGFPTGYALAFHAGLGAPGAWWGLAAGLASVALWMTLRFARMTHPGQ